jgi:uncharacterized protein YceH (UPF0502 family)
LRVDADPVELRVLGCLIEKQRTTPDAYPLSLNALRLACNQSTNRDPVVAYDEAEIRSALDRLARRGWARLASGRGSRAVKFRHLLDDALRLDEAELSLLAVLMLRGPQTPGELKQRTERLRPFAGLDEIDVVLRRLAERELAVRVPRRPGQKEDRYAQLLGGAPGGEDAGPQAPAQLTNRSAPPATVTPVLVYPDVRAAVAWLEQAFGFEERVRIGEEHRAQLRVGSDGAMVVADVHGERVPPTAGSVTHELKLRVPDVDAAFTRARDHGARVHQEPRTYEYGERSCVVEDVGGHRWELTQTVRDVAPEEWGGTSIGRW